MSTKNLGAFSCGSNPYSRTSHLLREIESIENKNGGRNPDPIIPRILRGFKRLLQEMGENLRDHFS